MKTYGQRLKELREARDLTQEAMAQQMGYARQANLSLYENDKKEPNLNTILLHAAFFGMKPSVFLENVRFKVDRVRAGEFDDHVPKPVRSRKKKPAGATGPRKKFHAQASDRSGKSPRVPPRKSTP